MTLEGRSPRLWLTALQRYLAVSAPLHLAWETLQLPLYTVWSEPVARQAFAVIHCTIGDLMIAGLSLLLALALVGRSAWPRVSVVPVWLLALVVGCAYTVYSEWLNISVRGNWAYAPLMPVVPIIGTGLAPLLQWLVVPSVAMRIAIGGSRS